MPSTIPPHYHQLPRHTGTNTVYPEGLTLWDVVNKRVILGDGLTEGGIPQAKFDDETTYVRRIIDTDRTADTKDWLIGTTDLTITLPPISQSIDLYVRVSAVNGATVTIIDSSGTVLKTLNSLATIELLGRTASSWIIIESTEQVDIDLSNYLQKQALKFNGLSTSSIISFIKIISAQYESLEAPVQDAIYWITDKGELWLNGVCYGTDNSIITVDDFPTSPEAGKIYVKISSQEVRYATGDQTSPWIPLTQTDFPLATEVTETDTDKAPTSSAVYSFVQAQLSHVSAGVAQPLLIQRPVSDHALFLQIDIATDLLFTNITKTIDTSINYNELYVAGAMAWTEHPSDGLGTAFDLCPVLVPASVFDSIILPCYIRYRWYYKNGDEQITTDYKLSAYPATMLGYTTYTTVTAID